MTRLRLVLRSALYYWRSHLGVLLGTAIGTAVLVGALVVGDSVQASLQSQARQRIGRTDRVLVSHDRFFRAALADELAASFRDLRVVPALRLSGVGSVPGGERRANDVRVTGIDARFPALGAAAWNGPLPGPRQVLVSERLASQLEVAVGDTILLRVEKPSGLPRDMALATSDDVATALRVEVVAIVTDETFGRFALEADQIPPFNAFVDLDWLQRTVERAGRANLLLVAGASEDSAPASEALDEALAQHWKLEDGELSLHDHESGLLELRSERIFLDPPVEEAVRSGSRSALGILTYFVNELRIGDRATPYSMVAGAGLLAGAPEDFPDWHVLYGTGLANDGTILGRWLATDLGAKAQDRLSIRYFAIGRDRRLVEKEHVFTVGRVTPLEGFAGDPSLMPGFPGLADTEDCRDWEPGIPVDLERIRDEDEAYWDDHHGTPKAFITLETAQGMWGNRFGALTAVRFSETDRTALEQDLVSALRPAALGLFFQDLRGQALASGRATTDFGGLFLGLSSFLLIAAFLLTALLFVFGVEQRASQVGLLLAVGWTPRQVRRLLLGEGLVLAVLGASLGVLGALGYTRLVLGALASVWKEAVASAAISVAISPMTLVLGAGISILAALAALAGTLRRQAKSSARELLGRRGGVGESGGVLSASRRKALVILTLVCVVAAIAIAVAVGPGRGTAAAGAFFGVGALLLMAGLFGSRLLLAGWSSEGLPEKETVGRLGLRNSTRRPGRSLATISLLASGTFLVVAVGANRLGEPEDPTRRDSGTGGFTLQARATIGVLHDLDSQDAIDAYALPKDLLAPGSVVSFRVRDGDEASCLNLNQTQQPRLVGVNPARLAEREAFRFTDHLGLAEGRSPWTLLEQRADGAIPAIGDAASVQWALHKSVGGTIDYLDERGRPFQVRIVGTVANSILQGNLVIGGDHFEELFPSESGYRWFLFDVAPARTDEVERELTRGLADMGLEVTDTAERLAAFNSVQNTYLVIFQMLGGLGLLLGAAGLGTVVLRNVLERRSELALVRAVGYRRSAVRWLVWSEHGALLALGLLSGILAAAVAVWPALADPGAESPWGAAGILVIGVAISGVAWVVAATWLALRGPLLAALRSE